MYRNIGCFKLIYLGLIWGFAEVTLGSLLHAIHFPYKGMVMTGIGLSIIAIYLQYNRTVWHPIMIGLIAGGVKCCGALLMGISWGSRAITNPVIAIITEAAIISAALAISPMLVTGFKRLLPIKKD